MYKIENLSKSYVTARSNQFFALDSISVDLPQKGLVFITGKSGSGKSTLLSIMGGIEKPTNGEIWFENNSLSKMNIAHLNQFRKKVGYVFQDFNLINDFTVYQNILLVNPDVQKVEYFLSQVGLNKKKNMQVRYLSGGEKQRLAIARCLAKQSKVILLDEPTGNLDSFNASVIFKILKTLSEKILVVIVSHDQSNVNQYADFVLTLKDAKLQQNSRVLKSKSIEVALDQKLDNSICELVDYVVQNCKYDNVRTTILSLKNEINIDKFVEKKFLLDFIIKSLSNYKSGDVLISCFLMSDKKAIEDIEIVNTCTDVLLQDDSALYNLTFKFCCKYAFKLIKSKIFRAVASIILLVISLCLVFFQTNLMLVNEQDLLYNSIKQNKEYLLPVTQQQYNLPTDQAIQVAIGKTFYENIIKDTYTQALPFFLANTDIDVGSNDNIKLTQYINIADVTTLTQMPIDLLYGDLPQENNQILITDLTSQILFDTTQSLGRYVEFGINNIAFNQIFTFQICGIIDTRFVQHDIENVIQAMQNYTEINQNKFTVAFITDVTYQNAILDGDSINIIGTIFDDSKKPNMIDYTNKSIRIAKLDDSMLGLDEQLDYNQVIISTTFFDKNKNFFATDDILSTMQKDYNLLDIAQSLNFVLYQQFFNLYSKTDTLKIVGIVENEHPIDIYVSQDLYKDISLEAEYFFVSGFNILVLDRNIQQTIKRIVDNKYAISLEYLGPIYSLQQIKQSSFQSVLIAVQVLLFIVAFASLFFFCILNVNSKLREIIIFKSLGFKSIRISLIFFIQNLFITVLAFMLSMIMSMIGIITINGILQNPDVLDINYNLLVINGASIIFVFATSLILSVLATTVPFLRILKSDIALQIKNTF